MVELRRKGLAESTIRSACTILLAVSDTADRDGALGLRMQDQQPTARGTRPTSSSDTGQRFSRPTARLAHAHNTALSGSHRTADDWGVRVDR